MSIDYRTRPNRSASASLSAGVRRVLVVGDSCSGKSTLAEALAHRLGAPYVELDALFWRPNWQEPEPDEFRDSVKAAVGDDAWVVSGNYRSRTRDLTWEHAEHVVWLDLPLWRTLPRIVRRSWRRARRRELLWGTNYEKFWPQLKVWSPKDSLIAYSVSTARRRRREMMEALRQGTAAGQRWTRLRSPAEVSRWLAAVQPASGG